MGYYTVLPGSKPEDNDSFLYVENVEDNQAATVRDAGENHAEVFEIEDDDAEVSDNRTNSSTSSDVLPINSLTRAPYRCRLCNQIKRGHNCPFKNSGAMADCVFEEPLAVGGSRKASNRENLSRLAQRVDDDESSDKDSDWTPTGFGKRKRGQAVNCMSTTNEREDWLPPKKMRKLHKCRKCLVPFKGHVCPHKHL